MALAFSKYFLQYFLLFIWFSGVNHFVNPSSEAGITVGSGMEPDYQEPLAMEDRHLYMHNRRLSLPPSHADPLQEPLRRHYKLDDFLWTGSGDGPHPSEQDGGLAWEDNGGGGPGEQSGHHSRSWVKVTKTMTLYRTVLTTIYPVEMTPTVVSGIPIEPTPHISSPLFSESVSVTSSFELDSSMAVPLNTWQVTPTFTPTPEPTQTYQISPSPTSSTTANQSNGVQENLSAESTDLVYWIQTSIKANDSAFRDAPKVFQSRMQKNLARVYASAFKRHLLTSLGVLPPSKSSKRRKRSSNNEDNHDDNLKRLYVALSSMSPTQLKNLATTTMNVTVTLLNVSSEQREPRVDLKYVVLAEGTPVPAFSAVKELDLVSKEEMEYEIGYEIIDKKAEALVAGPPEQMTRNDEIAATSPWLIVAVTTICLLVILLVLIAFMVWKWKHNRLGDSRRLPASISSRPQSGIEIEEGVINPAFLGTPSRIGHGGTHEPSPKSSPASSLLTRARTAKKISDILNRSSSRLDSGKTEGKKRGSRFDLENSPTSSEDLRQKRQMTSSEGSADWKELLGETRPKGLKGASAVSQARARQRSPPRQRASAVGKSERREKDVVRRRRRKSQVSKMEEATLKTDDDEMSHSSMDEDDKWEQDQESKSVVDAGPLPSRGGTDAISLGNLDICQDSIAKTPSEYAKRMVPWKRPGSAIPGSSAKSKSQIYGVSDSGGGRRPGSRLALPETIEEIPSFDLTEEDEGTTAREQDRDLSEKSFEMKDSPQKSTGSPPPDTKDAQVQTPTRISKTASHKARAAPKPRKNWRGSPAGPSESVISTESEEIVEVHHINSSMSDDQNPLGRMRKRFHQFLDDAFNVMGTTNVRRDDPDNQAETQSAKVSISHEVVETETQWRPWTSHVIREETLQKLKRPKSAAVPIGPPKKAWTASSERRTHSAKSKACSESKSVASTSRVASSADIQETTRPSRPLPPQQTQNEEDDSYDKTSTPCTTARDDVRVHTSGGGGANNVTSTSINTSDQSQSRSVILSPAFIFPQYPTYPDIRIETGGVGGGSSTSASNQSSQQQPPPSLPSNDPAVPLIQAIKNEMKRFEKDPTDPK
ncbi:unnamed protein product [Orchesella dallaii]|uniref:Uncharacterized protein n=1 Tax=Orchesella dallaii TaxID=48710 RepID=A0ABP1PPW4_9HEXA